MSITQLQAAGNAVGEIPKPIPAHEHLPNPGDMPLDFEQDDPTTRGLDDLNVSHHSSGAGDQSYKTGIAGPKGDFAVEGLGCPPATTPHRGGEMIALGNLDKIISDTEYTATFRKPQTSPTAFDPQSTTLL